MRTLRRIALSAMVAGLVLGNSPARAELPTLSYNPSSAEVLKFVVAAAEDSIFIEVASIGRSVKGKQIPVVILRDPTVSALDTRRIMILCRQHGNEPAGTIAALKLIRDVADRQPATLAQLRKLCLLIVPMVNPDGADADLRHNANDADLNRDWIYRKQPETQAVEYLYTLWKPETVLDLHELHWRDAHGLNTIEAPEPGVINESVAREARELQHAILARLDSSNFPIRVSSWNGSSNMGLCHRHFARDHGRVALLFESERQGMRTPLPRRAEMHRIGLQTVLDYYSRDVGNYPRLAFAPPANTTAAPETYLPAPSAQAGGENAAAYLGPAVRVEPKVSVSSPDLSKPLAPGKVSLELSVQGIADLTFVSVSVDGQGRFYTNRGPYRFELDTTTMAPGVHVLLAKAHRRDGTTVEQEYVVTVTEG